MKKRYVKLIILAFTVILNIIAWISSSFCDWYVENIFNITVNTWARFNSIFPFSVGEILIILGVILVAATIVIGILTPFIYIKRKKCL